MRILEKNIHNFNICICKLFLLFLFLIFNNQNIIIIHIYLFYVYLFNNTINILFKELLVFLYLIKFVYICLYVKQNQDCSVFYYQGLIGQFCFMYKLCIFMYIMYIGLYQKIATNNRIYQNSNDNRLLLLYYLLIDNFF